MQASGVIQLVRGVSPLPNDTWSKILPVIVIFVLIRTGYLHYLPCDRTQLPLIISATHDDVITIETLSVFLAFINGNLPITRTIILFDPISVA